MKQVVYHYKVKESSKRRIEGIKIHPKILDVENSWQTITQTFDIATTASSVMKVNNLSKLQILLHASPTSHFPFKEQKPSNTEKNINFSDEMSFNVWGIKLKLQKSNPQRKNSKFDLQQKHQFSNYVTSGNTDCFKVLGMGKGAILVSSAS